MILNKFKILSKKKQNKLRKQKNKIQITIFKQ